MERDVKEMSDKTNKKSKSYDYSNNNNKVPREIMYLASTSTDLKIHNSSDYTLKFTNQSYENSIKRIEWSSSGKYMLQVNPEGKLEILSVTEDGVRSLQYVPSSESTIGTFQSGNHREIGVGCASGNVFIWNTKFKSVVKSFPSVNLPVKLLSFNTTNSYLAASLENGNTVVFGVNTNNQVTSVKVPFSDNISVLKFHNKYRSILTLATDEGSILLKDLGIGKNKMFVRDAHSSVISGIAYSPVNEEVMLSCSFDKKMNLHDTRVHSIEATIQTSYALTAIDMKDATTLALGNKKGEILLYDLRKFSSPLVSIYDHQSSVVNVNFQPEQSKNKKYFAVDTSVNESNFPKLLSPKSPLNIKSPEHAQSFNFTDFLCSPVAETAPSSKEMSNNGKACDSFLVNILGNGNSASGGKNLDIQCKDSSKNVSKSNLFLNMSKSGDVDTSVKDVLDSPPCFTTFSTPITERVSNINNTSPLLVDNNENIQGLSHSSLKKINSVDSISIVETIKNVNNPLTELGSEFKDILKYSMHDVMQGCRRNYINMTLEQVKNRIYFEDQIAMMSRKMDDLLQNQNLLIEQNKKLLIELEMLRCQPK